MLNDLLMLGAGGAHSTSLISMVAVGFAFAFVFGIIANRLRLPPLVGYLVAGIVLARYTPGFHADEGLADQLAEIGVMLLMFGVGLHFSIADLMAVRNIAIPGAIGQIVLATGMGALLAVAFGLRWGEGFILGLSLSVASTVVLLKSLEERNAVATTNGRIAIGWLVVEDLVMVLTLVLLPSLAPALGGKAPAGGEGGSLILTLAVTLVKVTIFIATALTFGPRFLPWMLRQVARTGSRELFTLSVLAAALGIAFGATLLFGISLALGAFFAGMVLHESELSHKAAENSLPLQDAFSVLFFVAVGMKFDPAILVEHPVMVAAVVLLIIVGKSLVALLIVLLLRFPISTALTVSAALAQIGEFSFILAGLGNYYEISKAGDTTVLSLVLAGAIISITLNPAIFMLTARLATWAASHPKLGPWLETGRTAQIGRLEAEMEVARKKAEEKAAAHKTFTPEELVEHFPLFAGLLPEQREVLLLHFEPHTSQPGDRIIRAGDQADKVYFISEGEVEVSVKGRRIKLGPGSYFGEMALISGQPRSADVTAMDYSRFATLSRTDFQKFVKRYPDMRDAMAKMAAERAEMNRKVEEDKERAATPPG